MNIIRSTRIAVGQKNFVQNFSQIYLMIPWNVSEIKENASFVIHSNEQLCYFYCRHNDNYTKEDIHNFFLFQQQINHDKFSTIKQREITKNENKYEEKKIVLCY